MQSSFKIFSSDLLSLTYLHTEFHAVVALPTHSSSSTDFVQYYFLPFRYDI